MAPEYKPIETKADVRAAKVEAVKDAVGNALDAAGDHLKSRLSPKTIGKEILSHLTDRVIPHGANELGNAIFAGDGYLPWPGNSNAPSQEQGGVHGLAPPDQEAQPNQPTTGQSRDSLDAYTRGSIEPTAPSDHKSLYVSNYGEGKSHVEMLSEAARRGSDQSQDRSRSR